MSLLLALALSVAASAADGPAYVYAAQKAPGPAAAANPEQDRFDQALDLIQKGRAADALPLLDSVIAALEAAHARDPSRFYCARSAAETFLYSGMGARDNKATKVVDELWCNGYFFKGFALVELGRNDEAKRYLDKAIELAPMNSHFLGERAEWHKNRKDWDRAFAEFQTASDASRFSPDEMKSFDQRRAWRGMAFVRIEQGKLDEAEQLLRQCLQLEPGDENAKKELDYIKSLRPPVS